MLFCKGQDVAIAGQVFPYDTFEYLLNRFKEAFSHTSLTIEEAFQELDDLDLIINSSLNEEAYQYYCCLSSKEQKEITGILHQIIVFKASRYGVFSEPVGNDQKQIDLLYKKYFSYFDTYIYHYIKFDSQGNFDKVGTFHNLDTLFLNLPRRNKAYEKAYGMQRDHLDAFDYAMSLDDLGIADTIQINAIVNESDEDKVIGYKKTNNDILSASFTPTDKKNVPIEMQKLFADYKNDFGMDIKNPEEPGISPKERYERACNIFRREALFHIRFIRIHPFNDGNGRTGRIILNYHLLKEGLAPAMISHVLADDYRKCINDYDVEGLAKMLFNSSSLQIANWVSIKKVNTSISRRDINPDNSRLAAILGHEEENTTGRNKILTKFNSFLL